MIFSTWNPATDDRDSLIDGSEDQIETLAAASITAGRLDSAAILVYFTYPGAGITPLPYTSDAGGEGSVMSFIPEVGRIIITRWTFDNSTSLGFGDLQFLFVIVPGGTPVPDAFRQAARNMKMQSIQ